MKKLSKLQFGGLGEAPYMSMKNNKAWFDNHANWSNTGNAAWDAKTRQLLMSGRFGVNPNTNALIKLPENEWTSQPMSNENVRLNTDSREWSPQQKQESWKKKVTPTIVDGTRKLMTNPVMMAPGMILTAGMGAPALAATRIGAAIGETAAATSSAMSAPIAGVQGLTGMNLFHAGLTAKGMIHGFGELPKVGNSIAKAYNQPNMSNIGEAAYNTASTALDILPTKAFTVAGNMLRTHAPHIRESAQLASHTLGVGNSMFTTEQHKEGGSILNNNNMNMFNKKKSLRSFEKGGVKPTYNPDDNPEEYAKRLAQWETDNKVDPFPTFAPVPVPASLRPGPSMTAAPIAPITPIPGGATTDYQGESIVDFLKSMGVDSSKANRKKLATLSGDNDYDMSGSDNKALMDYIRKNTQGSKKIDLSGIGINGTSINIPQNKSIRNSDGNIVSIDGASQVPLTIKNLDNLNRTGSVTGKKKTSNMTMAQMEKYMMNNNPNGTSNYLKPRVPSLMDPFGTGMQQNHIIGTNQMQVIPNAIAGDNEMQAMANYQTGAQGAINRGLANIFKKKNLKYLFSPLVGGATDYYAD